MSWKAFALWQYFGTLALSCPRLVEEAMNKPSLRLNSNASGLRFTALTNPLDPAYIAYMQLWSSSKWRRQERTCTTARRTRKSTLTKNVGKPWFWTFQDATWTLWCKLRLLAGQDKSSLRCHAVDMRSMIKVIRNQVLRYYSDTGEVRTVLLYCVHLF